MRALITGGAGFIGSHLADFLVGEGHAVLVVDDLSTGSLDNVAHLMGNPSFKCVIGSILDERLIGKLVDRSDAVFHLAAGVGVKLVTAQPLHTIEANVRGTETVLKHASRRRTPVLVTSTSEVYGKGAALPYREDADLVLGAPHKTRWGYAASKLIDEFMALGYYKSEGLPVTIVRLFNTVGPRQSSRYGMVMPTFVRQALNGDPLTVHGDGSQTRSFTWVGDVVWALARLINEPHAWGQVFNVGNGAEVSILELAHLVKEMTGSRSAVQFEPYEQAFDDTFEDMPRRVPDIRKLHRATGYVPRVHLPEMVGHVIDDVRGRLRHPVPPVLDSVPAHCATPDSAWTLQGVSVPVQV